MGKKISLFYREILNDYVVNERGKMVYEPRNSSRFEEIKEAQSYIVKNYGGKKTSIHLDQHCLEEGGSELENKLKKAKINVIDD